MLYDNVAQLGPNVLTEKKSTKFRARLSGNNVAQFDQGLNVELKKGKSD